MDTPTTIPPKSAAEPCSAFLSRVWKKICGWFRSLDDNSDSFFDHWQKDCAPMGWHPKTVVGRLIHVIVFVPWAVAHAILTVVGFLSILAIALGLMLAALPVLGLIVLVLYVKGGNPQNSNL